MNDKSDIMNILQLIKYKLYNFINKVSDKNIISIMNKWDGIEDPEEMKE
jgi:GTPase involved in cell partitioning and DNA repair